MLLMLSDEVGFTDDYCYLVRLFYGKRIVAKSLHNCAKYLLPIVVILKAGRELRQKRA